jgi:hypothetical protein
MENNKGAAVVNVASAARQTQNILACVRAIMEMLQKRDPDDPEARAARESMRWFAQEHQRRVERLERLNPQGKTQRLERSVLLAQCKQLARELGNGAAWKHEIKK